MKTYEITKENLEKYIGDRAVVFEKEDEISNIKIIATVQVERGFQGRLTCIPDIQIGNVKKSPTMLNAGTLLDFGWKTFSID